ncbi:MAG: hypothetical protein A2Y50_04070 [Pseudomonadales bacterium RIFCSPLOWO2_12_59_9]|nr:MAG: hypothetical protein A2Y50_04070 [Pseudomonadales bacterium RIFCSPLOWO2_12_59_9]
MMMIKPSALVAALALGLSACSSQPPTETSATSAASQAQIDEAKQIATDAYVFGYSLLTTEVTRVQMSNVPKAEGLHAPMGQFINIKRYPPAEFRAVSAPNADTLYSLAWLDLSEPQVFSHPDMGKRYYLFPFTDLWMTDFHTPGTRTTGEKAANYLVTGPGWQGTVPAGMTQIKSDSRYTVILGRTYADGSDKDYQAVNALQAQYKITPLSAWGKPYSYQAPAVDPNPGFSMTDKPQTVLLTMDTNSYFNKMAQLMCKDAPPAAQDAPMLARMAKIGLEPCKAFDIRKLDPQVQTELNKLPQEALQLFAINKKKMGTLANGWIISKGLGVYGTDYMKRAVVAAFGWPANLQDDAVYPYTEVDSDGQKLNGANNYRLTFAKGQTPPVKAFWSITMYQIDQGWWFVPNALNKFTVSPRDKLKYNADGSLTLYLQHESPGKAKQANWLPAPTGDFIPMMRMYWPNTSAPSVLNDTWAPPKIVKVQ